MLWSRLLSLDSESDEILFQDFSLCVQFGPIEVLFMNDNVQPVCGSESFNSRFSQFFYLLDLFILVKSLVGKVISTVSASALFYSLLSMIESRGITHSDDHQRNKESAENRSDNCNRSTQMRPWEVITVSNGCHQGDNTPHSIPNVIPIKS